MGKNNPPLVEGSALDDIMNVGGTFGAGTISDGADWIYAYGGNDIVVAGGGNDRVFGGDGNDSISGGTGRDRLYGDHGNDVILGGDDSDWLYGGVGNDLLFGEHGNDLLKAGSGNDTLVGGIGNDTLYGNKGNNELFGGEGSDVVNSGDNSSTLDGGAGDDVLVLRTKKGADHVATGGTGADEFQFLFTNKPVVSETTITDFELGVDSFSIDGVDDDNYLQFLSEAAVTEVNGNAVLTMTSGDTVTFEGVTEAEFEAHYSFIEDLFAV